METIWACIWCLSLGSTHPKLGLYLWSLFWLRRHQRWKGQVPKALKLSTSFGQHSVGFGCRSIFSGGVQAALRSNYICSLLHLPDLLQLMGFSSSLSILGLFHSPYPFLECISSSQISKGLSNIINVLSHWGTSFCWHRAWAQCEYQCPILGAGDDLEYLGFHTCSEWDLTCTFKDRGINGLSHFQLPNNCTSSIDFHGPMWSGRAPHWTKPLCRLE